MEIRVPHDLSSRLIDETRSRRGRESVVFALVSSASAGDRNLVLVRDLRGLPDSAYINDARHGAKWGGNSMFPILSEAMERKLGVVMFHTHGTGRVRLSRDDEDSAKNLLPRFQNLIPERPHGSVVFGPDTAPACS